MDPAPARPPMTPRANLLSAFRHALVDWIPWTPYVGGVNTPCFVPEEIKRRQDFVEIGLCMQEVVGCDILIAGTAVKLCYASASMRRYEDDASIMEEMAIGSRTLQRMHRRFMYGDQGTTAISRYPVQTVEDIATFRQVLADGTPQPSTDWASKAARLGERGLVHSNGPRTPLMSLIIDHMGLEGVVSALSDIPDQVHALLADMHQANLALCDALCVTPVEVVGIFDDFDTLLISPTMFRRLVKPYLKEYVNVLHAAGKMVMVHSCGHVRHFLKDILDVGYDAHNYLTPPPTGNTPLAEARQIWGEQITIMPSIDPVRMENGEASEIETLTQRTLLEVGSDRSFVLMTSAKSTVPEANLRAVARVLGRG